MTAHEALILPRHHLPLAIERGDVGALRKHFSESFWHGQNTRVRWGHLEAALYKADPALLETLLPFVNPAHLEDKERMRALGGVHLSLLKRAGVRLPIPTPATSGVEALPSKWIASLNAVRAQTQSCVLIGGSGLRDLLAQKPVGPVDLFVPADAAESVQGFALPAPLRLDCLHDFKTAEELAAVVGACTDGEKIVTRDISALVDQRRRAYNYPDW